MTTLPAEVPVFVTWEDEAGHTRRQAIVMAWFHLGARGAIAPLPIPLPERGQRLTIQTYRAAPTGGYRTALITLYVIDPPTYTMRAAYGSGPSPDQPQAVSSVTIPCELVIPPEEER